MTSCLRMTYMVIGGLSPGGVVKGDACEEPDGDWHRSHPHHGGWPGMRITNQNSSIMKTLTTITLAALMPSILPAQEIINNQDFFDPDFRARRAGASGVINLVLNNNPVSAGPQSSGDSTWTHSAGGFAQAGVVVVGDVQLAAYTQTTGDSLVFGREITSSALLSLLQAPLNQVTGASVLYNWESEASVSGLAIAPDQLYRVDFTVTSGGGLPVDLLSSATFGITTAGITGASNGSAQLLNLLDVVSIGADSSTGDFSFVFKSSQALDTLDFNFAATSGVGVSLLGGTAANQNVLTYSGFSVTQIPEPGTTSLLGVMAGCLMLRRRVR